MGSDPEITHFGPFWGPKHGRFPGPHGLENHLEASLTASRGGPKVAQMEGPEMVPKWVISGTSSLCTTLNHFPRSRFRAWECQKLVILTHFLCTTLNDHLGQIPEYPILDPF